MSVKKGAILIEFTSSSEREISADLWMSFVARLVRARIVFACFFSVLMPTVDAIFTMAIVVMKADCGRHFDVSLVFLKYIVSFLEVVF